MPTTEPTDMNVPTLMRKLRAVVGNYGFKKIGHTTWSNRTVTIELNYYCKIDGRTPWSDHYQTGLTRKAMAATPGKECFPTAVSVRRATESERFGLPGHKRPPTDIDHIRWDGSGVTGGTYRKRLDGTFNLEAIAACITRITTKLGTYVARVETSRKADKARRHRSRAMSMLLGPQQDRMKNGVTTSTHPQHDGYTAHVSFHGLTVAEVKHLQKVARNFPKRSAAKDE